jgi:hypothetical protein
MAVNARRASTEPEEGWGGASLKDKILPQVEEWFSAGADMGMRQYNTLKFE